MMRPTQILVALLTGAALGLNSAAQNSPPPSPPKPDFEAQALVRDLLAQKPAKAAVIHGILKTRNDDSGQRASVPLTYSVQPGEETWRGVYETEASGQRPAEKLVVVHYADRPNEYFYTSSRDSENSSSRSVTLTGIDAAIPFAGSDFWLSDLGLEFLHWPEQRLIRNLKITSTWGYAYYVLESINPNPTDSHYARVISRIEKETGGILKAEAYAAGQTKPFKVFELKRFRKGEVKEMGIRNENTNSRTQLEFSYDVE